MGLPRAHSWGLGWPAMSFLLPQGALYLMARVLGVRAGPMSGVTGTTLTLGFPQPRAWEWWKQGNILLSRACEAK